MQIYGSDAETAAKLRSWEGGRLKGNAEKEEDALMPFVDVRRCPDAQEDEETLRVSLDWSFTQLHTLWFIRDSVKICLEVSQ